MRAIKPTVSRVIDLYESYQMGGENGWFAFVTEEGKFYEWKDDQWKEVVLIPLTVVTWEGPFINGEYSITDASTNTPVGLSAVSLIVFTDYLGKQKKIVQGPGVYQLVNGQIFELFVTTTVEETVVPQNTEYSYEKIPVFRYQKDPVDVLYDLYLKYPNGGELGWFSFVKEDKTFAYWDVEYGMWSLLSGGSSGGGHVIFVNESTTPMPTRTVLRFKGVLGVDENGETVIDGLKGDDGQKGDDGITPTIGVNGNWYLGTTDTGVKAAGTNGNTPYIQADYWWINGANTGIKAKGTDGVTPTISIAEGEWYINGNPTGVTAVGTNGTNGTNGVGISSITLISTVGLVKTYRILFTNSTTFTYTVTDGADGTDGQKGDTGDVGLISSYTNADTLEDTDITLIEKAGVKLKLTFSLIKSTLKTYFDTVYATVENLLLKRDKTEIGDAHGFVNPPNISNFTLSNSGSSITVELLSNAGAYKINGTDFVNNGLTLTFTASLGQNSINVNASGLVASAIDILDLTKIPCCTINWDGTTAVLADELHSSRRNLLEHKKQHDTDGGRWVSGGVTTFGSSANNTFSHLQSVIRDEDRYHTIVGTRTQGMILYRNSALTAMIADAASTRFCKLVNTTTGAPYYDLNGTPTALNNNAYGVYWMYATNRKLPVNSEIVFVMGQGTYTSVANAQAAAQPTLSGMTVAEWKLMYRVIIRNVGGTLNFIQADDLRLVSSGLAVSGSGVNSLPASQITSNYFGNLQLAEDTLRLDSIPLYCSDMTSDITASTTVAKIRFTFEEARVLNSVVGDLQTAAVGGLFTVDIKKNGTSIFSTLLTFDSTENTTRTAATPYVLTGSISFAVGDYIDIYVTLIGSSTAGKGLLITLLTTK